MALGKNLKRLGLMILFGLAFVFNSLAVAPRATIELVVLDEKTGKFFPNVQVLGVFDDESGKKIQLAEKNTDARGQYLDFVTTNGKFILTVTAPGYQTEKVEGEVKGTDVRVSRRIRNKIILRKEVAAEKEPLTVTESDMALASTFTVTPMATEQILSETGWGDPNSLQSAVLEALFYNDVHVGNALWKLCSATLLFQESFLRGLLQSAKEYCLSDNFEQDYLQRRKDWYRFEEDAEDVNFPKSPQEFIKKKLQWFLDESASVDFKAETKTKDCFVIFVSEEYEKKSKMWKKCYRAGPYLTEIARDFASEWIAALGK